MRATPDELAAAQMYARMNPEAVLRKTVHGGRPGDVVYFSLGRDRLPTGPHVIIDASPDRVWSSALKKGYVVVEAVPDLWATNGAVEAPGLPAPAAER
jgi:hypothetical protein